MKLVAPKTNEMKVEFNLKVGEVRSYHFPFNIVSF